VVHAAPRLIGNIYHAMCYAHARGAAASATASLATHALRATCNAQQRRCRARHAAQRAACSVCRSFGDGWAFSHLSVQLARYSGDGRGYVKVRATGIAARRGISHAAQE
jgi:hypothetical protein